MIQHFGFMIADLGQVLTAPEENDFRRDLNIVDKEIPRSAGIKSKSTLNQASWIN